MKLLLIVAAIASGFIVLEVSLRLFGLGNPPLYIPDAEIGYLLAPNQRVRRFGNRIEINQYAMRTGAIALQRPAETLRIFLLGDSVANGAWWTDQEETISALIEQQLQTTATVPQVDPAQSDRQRLFWRNVEVLNASANSWGPRNELAYLQRYGTFEAQLIVLLINTDDLFATAPTSLPVGQDRNYPDRKTLALAEVARRWQRPSPIPGLDEVRKEGGDRVGFNLAAITQIKAIAKEHKAQFLLAMTPLLRECEATGPRDYELKARERLTQFASEHQISYIDFLPLFKPDCHQLYRDHIHLSPQGNQLVSRTLSQRVTSDQLPVGR
ncbi:MAG: SGNH/GDSL hydrolase family protein [Cyanophyceae cyanobacterium]